MPLLEHGSVKIGQSVAALEYLEEAFPESRSLLPPKEDVAGRAFVRSIVQVVVADIQPVTSLRLLNAVEALGAERLSFAREWTARGLEVVERMLVHARGEAGSGKYCYGGIVTMADVCLVAAGWNAKVYGVDLRKFSQVNEVIERMEELEEVKKAEPGSQEDAPNVER